MFETREGISTFIATLLLMVLAVSAGVVIYAYTMGYLGGFGVPQTMGAISLDTTSLVFPTGPTVALTAYVRNIGKTDFILDTVYLDGRKLTVTTDYNMVYPNSGSSIPESGVGTLEIYQKIGTPNRFVSSTTYEIKMIGKDNTQLSFQVKK